ncbi:MAG: tetratricopeptide repeat protein [Anaerolineales bacterium]|nr:tetratricopeptide repeat protein [Anaerolineales bacterium]
MNNPDIVTVDETNFEYQVLVYSETVPVLVYFWANWSDACQRTNPLLETLANENSGRFRLAKVDVDRNVQLTQRYQVHTVPTLKTFENGFITRQIVGVKTNMQVIDFVKEIVPGPENLLIEKAANLLLSEEYQDVEKISREILENDPANPKANLLLAKSLIWQGVYQEANFILEHFPSSPEFQQAEKLQPLIEVLILLPDLGSESDDPLDAVYFRAVKLISLGNIPASMDGFLEILRKDKTYRSGLPKNLFLGLFELLGDDHPHTQEYRPQLANILF